MLVPQLATDHPGISVSKLQLGRVNVKSWIPSGIVSVAGKFDGWKASNAGPASEHCGGRATSVPDVPSETAPSPGFTDTSAPLASAGGTPPSSVTPFQPPFGLV